MPWYLLWLLLFTAIARDRTTIASIVFAAYTLVIATLTGVVSQQSERQFAMRRPVEAAVLGAEESVRATSLSATTPPW